MREVRMMRLAAASLVTLLVLGPDVLSAQATGAITGLATDASGALLPGVTVDATNPDTGQVRTAVTAADGFYTIPLLPPGRYQIQATLSGFRTTIREGIIVVV